MRAALDHGRVRAVAANTYPRDAALQEQALAAWSSVVLPVCKARNAAVRYRDTLRSACVTASRIIADIAPDKAAAVDQQRAALRQLFPLQFKDDDDDT